MTKEQDKLLVTRYPMLYGQRNKDMTETCMCWGFECGAGWFDLINDLSAGLEAINRRIEKDYKKRKLFLNILFFTSLVCIVMQCIIGFMRIQGVEISWIYQFIFSSIGFPLLICSYFPKSRLRFYPIEATQVKEKFATLRFYTNGIPLKYEKEHDALIERAECRSAETCEQCGQPGRERGKGWFYTACDECEEKRQKGTSK